MCQPYLLNVGMDEDVIGNLMGFLSERQREPQPRVAADAPYAPVHTGIVQKTLAGRTVMYHIPEAFEVSGAGLFWFLDDGQTCEAFLQTPAWRRHKQDQNVVTILLEPEETGWSKKNIAQEMAFVKTVFADAIARDHFSLNEATYYAFGTGAGAYPAATFALLYASVLSGFAVDGDANLHPDLMAQLAALPSDGDRCVPRAQVPLPAWIFDRKGTMDSLLSYLKRANYVDEAGMKTEHYTAFLPNIQQVHATVNSLPCVHLRHSNYQQATQLKSNVLQQALAFLLQHKRWINDQNGDFRPAKSENDMGLIRFEKEFQGRRRHWYVAIPPNAGDAPLPLVFALHGYSCTGKLYAENSHWHEVGNKRGFIVVYPTAYPCSMNGCTPLPLWNCGQFPGEDGIDDVAFLLDVLQDVKTRYAVDEERLYVAGHSNGSAMTQALMVRAGHMFAAFAPVGYTYGESLQPDRQDVILEQPRDGIKRPVWLMKGECDIGCAACLDEENANTRFIRTMCAANQAVGDAARHTFGIYENDTWFDAQGIPVVRFTKACGMPHAYTPEMAWLTWDLFFSRFSRAKGGELNYAKI